MADGDADGNVIVAGRSGAQLKMIDEGVVPTERPVDEAIAIDQGSAVPDPLAQRLARAPGHVAHAPDDAPVDRTVQLEDTVGPSALGRGGEREDAQARP